MIKLRWSQRVPARIGPLFGFLPERVQRRLAGPPVTIDVATLAPDMQILLKVLERRGVLADESPGRLRKRQAIGAIVATGAPVHIAGFRDLEVDGLRARHYASTAGAPLVVFFHGGGSCSAISRPTIGCAAC